MAGVQGSQFGGPLPHVRASLQLRPHHVDLAGRQVQRRLVSLQVADLLLDGRPLLFQVAQARLELPDALLDVRHDLLGGQPRQGSFAGVQHDLQLARRRLQTSQSLLAGRARAPRPGRDGSRPADDGSQHVPLQAKQAGAAGNHLQRRSRQRHHHQQAGGAVAIDVHRPAITMPGDVLRPAPCHWNRNQRGAGFVTERSLTPVTRCSLGHLSYGFRVVND